MRWLDQKQLLEWANRSKSGAAPIVRALLEANDNLKRARKPKAKAQAIRPRWTEDLIDWCREHGIVKHQDILDYFEIDRTTLFRWKRGDNVSPANITKIIEKTFGEIDPRKPRRRRSRVARHVGLAEAAVIKTSAVLKNNGATAPNADRANTTLRAELDESRRKLDAQHRKDAKDKDRLP
jgi:hypothetical protein